MTSIPQSRSGDTSPQVLVIVPAFNEAESLPGLIEKLSALCPHYDIVVVNDGSTDQTGAVVAGTRARLVSLPCNLGIGGAVQTGLRIARDEDYDVAIQVDGDGQHPPDQVQILVEAIFNSGCDLAIGSRFLTHAGYQSTLDRRIGIRFFSRLLSAICRTRITDATSGFRAMNRRAINLLASHYAEDYPEVEAILVAHRARLRICEVPVQMSARRRGTSSIRSFHAIGYMLKVSLAILMCSIRKPEVVS